jgi:suppressor of tumorigenicity protein 13
MYESGEDYDLASTFKIEAGDLKAEGRYEEALEKYTLAICAAPPSALLLANRGDTLFHLSRFQAAIKDCTVALDQNPDSAKALRIRGRCYKEMGEFELARKDLSAAQTIDYTQEGGVVEDLKFVIDKCMDMEVKRAHERVQVSFLRSHVYHSSVGSLFHYSISLLYIGGRTIA